MPYASELKQLDKKPTENENFLTNTENETELPAEVPSTSFTERSDEEIEADLDELRAHLQAIISDALPGFYEYQQAGYNLLYPKKVDIDALQARVNTMQIPALIQPQHKLLKQAANAFLDRFRLLRKEGDLHNNALEFIKFRLEVNKAGWDEPQSRDYHQALKHSNRLSGYLSGTLDLMSLLNENVERQTPWETTRQAHYDVLLNELLPINADAHNNQYAAKTRGNLTGKQPDNIKFDAIVDSVTLDERIVRETVSAEIERLSARLLSGIRLTRNYAEKPDETGETSEIKRDIDFLCQVLQSVIRVVQYAGQLIQPDTYQPLRQKEARTTREMVTHELGKAWNAVGQKMQGAKASVQTLSDKGNKNKHRVIHALPSSTASDKNGDSHNINKAVFQVGIRLLNKIQQTTSDMHKAIQTSRPLQQAVSHYSELNEMLSDMPHNSILDTKLRAESSRWRQKADASKEQLQQLLGTITTLSDERMKQRYLSELREELNSVTNPLASNYIIRDFDTQVKATVEGLSGIQKALGQALLRLSGHGQASGEDLDKLTVSWLQQLKDIKNKLKTGIMKATGQSINNFSRQGMLARWMAEWREAEKQRYLGTLSAEGRAVTEKHYDTVFFEVIQHYLPLLSKESDPQGERLLQRLRLEVGNAANGNTLYPVTMADILAGMKSRERAIRDWSERKLISGAFLAVCLGGVKLLPNLAALPLRLPIKFAITGAKVARGAHKGRQGIRGGEGDVKDEIAEYVKQSYKTAAIKIVLSLPPGLATTLGVASIAWSVYEGGLKGAGEKIAKHIIGEVPWRALDTGSRAVAEAYVTTLIDAAITEEETTSVSHSTLLQPQTYVKPLSDAHEPDAEQPRVRRKRAVENTARPQSPKWHENIPSDATLQSEHFDFDRDIRYQTFSVEQKKQTYLHGIQFVLLQIENDRRFSTQIRNNAYLARIGAKLLVPVDIKGFKLNNTIFLPDSRGAKSGVLIRLDSEVPYYYVDEGKDLLDDIEWALPHDPWEPHGGEYFASYKKILSPSEALHELKSGFINYKDNFIFKNPEPMSIASLSEVLVNTIENDYKLKGQTITNKLLISRAIAGAHIPDPGVTATEAGYHLEFTWDNLTPAEYLRSFSRPFSTLSGEMQLVSSSIKGETIQETELHVHQAEYIGSWVDATVGATISFTPAGWVFNTAQSAMGIAADLKEGKAPDPLAVAGLVVGCIPGGRIAAKVGKFTRIGGKIVKYGIMLGNKAVDLAIVGSSIKTAVDTGEPLAIYQALLASGMSVKDSYGIAKKMSSTLEINKTINDSASLKQLKSYAKKMSIYSKSVNMPLRTFRVGTTDIQGKIENKQFMISEDYGSTWRKGSDLELFAYGLQDSRQTSFGQVTEHNVALNKPTRVLLKKRFKGEKIKTFDATSSRYKKSNEFTLAHAETATAKLKKVLSKDMLRNLVSDSIDKLRELQKQIKDYNGSDKKEIFNNFDVAFRIYYEMMYKLNDSGESGNDSFYVLVKKDESENDLNNYYGVAYLTYDFKLNKVNLDNLAAHPYVIVNKYKEFKNYLIDKSFAPEKDLSRYDIKNVAKYLGYQSSKEEIRRYDSIPGNKVKYFSFSGANPITQSLGYKIERISKLFSRVAPDISVGDVDVDEDVDLDELKAIASSSRHNDDPFSAEIEHLKSIVRTEFMPVKPIELKSDIESDRYITSLMNEVGAQIVSESIAKGLTSDDAEVSDFSRKVIDSVKVAYNKASKVKGIFDLADSTPELKENLRGVINEAVGLNDDVIFDIDKVDADKISTMAYNRFRDNVYALYDFLGNQENENYNSFVLFKHKQYLSSKPTAYAMPFDSKKRILLAIVPHNDGLANTIVHEASHNANYTLDHTYLGNVRNENGSFANTFDASARDSKYFYENQRVSSLSARYALGLPENAELSSKDEAKGHLLLQFSKLIKADTLLNSAEYNTFMIDVLYNSTLVDMNSGIEKLRSRNKRSIDSRDYNLDNLIMLSSLITILPVAG
ncbi:hypothetical protein ACGGX0_003510 [Salmonella enterica]|nr:hypothetical protein [Salmonella enterica]EKS4590812.1 hypothetical protein [Salmonella enterica]EKS4835234.1 hypothetical protein [Salmonella enterica]EKS6168733.1 hypothetical protein [Salmonella enterica]